MKLSQSLLYGWALALGVGVGHLHQLHLVSLPVSLLFTPWLTFFARFGAKRARALAPKSRRFLSPAPARSRANPFINSFILQIASERASERALKPRVAMSTQRNPHLTSRRHAELLRHLLQDGGAAVKDLRLRRVVPLASAPLDSSPAKPGSAETTPPETQDRERKPVAVVVQRSKFVRGPASFGYHRLLPFLNELANHDSSSGKDNSKSELSSSSSLQSVDESADAEAEAGAVDCSISAKEETKIGPAHLSSGKPCLTRCQRSRFVHHLSSFSYKRMLPFLMENEISYQEGHRAKIPRIVPEKESSTDENGILTSRHHHFAMSGNSAEECETSQAKRLVREIQSESEDGACLLNGGFLQPGVSEASHLEGNPVEVQKLTQQRMLASDEYPLSSDKSLLQPGVSEASHLEDSPVEVQKLTEQRMLASDGYPLSSDKGEVTSNWNDVLPTGQYQLAVSEETPEESNKADVDMALEEKESVPDGNSVCHGRQLQTFVSKVSAPEGSTSQMQKATQKQAVTPDGNEENPLVSGKDGFLAKEQPQIHVTELPVKGNAECYEVPHCQSLGLGCSDGCGPTKVVIPLVNRHGALEQPDSMASLDEPLLDVEMTCSPFHPYATDTPFSVEETSSGVLYTPDACAIGTPLSVEEMSGSHIEPSSSKVSTVDQRGAPCLEKRGFSPKKFSPKKGILKRYTRGCKGICMCLDCSTFRIHADRAFEFSRKQMQEADDIIDNLLKEVGNLRNLMEKSAGQEEPAQTACRRASQVEEVARERRREMLMELNSHCRIPGPRVRFAQYVEERIASSPSAGRSR
ncbi:hypothetical protein ABZP36_015894 [Zizania latifolia]